MTAPKDTVDPRISPDARKTLRIVSEFNGLNATQRELFVTLVNMVFCEGVGEGLNQAKAALGVAISANPVINPSQSHDYTTAQATER